MHWNMAPSVLILLSKSSIPQLWNKKKILKKFIKRETNESIDGCTCRCIGQWRGQGNFNKVNDKQGLLDSEKECRIKLTKK